ncbi:peroxisomal biogenesis factor 11 [Jimgerdemannia flammicorona]|uniref:Peroxisomal biogenesis factor 11 n=1 Tax=Jimgerdemannia flammicorona TaxID=994334 RepID=A0A433D564_9FUNG|nr:peroxisomal biogenesis factor 11 [Jimgerdemannia flammicorona]
MTKFALTTPVPLDHLLKFLATTQGREKTYRGVQYFARFWVWYLIRQGAAKESIQKWDDLKKSLGVGRKLFRLAKPLEAGQSAIRALENSDEVLRFTQAGRNAAYSAYYVCEMLVWLHQVGFRKVTNQKQIGDMGHKFWTAALSFSIVSSLYSLRRVILHEELLERRNRAAIAGQGKDAAIQGADYKVEKKTLEKERSTVVRQLVLDGIDIIIPLSSLGWLNVDEGVVGLAGVITSLMAAQSQWKKVNPK